MPPTLYENMKKFLRISYKVLVVAVAVGFLVVLSLMKVWEVALLALGIFFVANIVSLTTGNHKQASKNLKGFFQWLKEDAHNIKTWIIGE